MSTDFSHLSDPGEREWLTNVEPLEVLRNAHRFYEFLRENGLHADSYTRELAFEKAESGLGVDYDVLYDAWLSQSPAKVVTITPHSSGDCAYCERAAAFEVRVTGTVRGLACRAHVGDLAGNLAKADTR